MAGIGSVAPPAMLFRHIGTLEEVHVSKLVYDPEKVRGWRFKAQALRAWAMTTRDPQARRTYETLAVEWERLADHGERSNADDLTTPRHPDR
jgi:hypothetical protein